MRAGKYAYGVKTVITSPARLAMCKASRLIRNKPKAAVFVCFGACPTKDMHLWSFQQNTSIRDQRLGYRTMTYNGTAANSSGIQSLWFYSVVVCTLKMLCLNYSLNSFKTKFSLNMLITASSSLLFMFIFVCWIDKKWLIKRTQSLLSTLCAINWCRSCPHTQLQALSHSQNLMMTSHQPRVNCQAPHIQPVSEKSCGFVEVCWGGCHYQSPKSRVDPFWHRKPHQSVQSKAIQKKSLKSFVKVNAF